MPWTKPLLQDSASRAPGREAPGRPCGGPRWSLRSRHGVASGDREGAWCTPRLVYLLVELPRLVLRFSAQFAAEHTGAELILAERLRSPVLADVQSHKRAMHGLLERV